jgi:nucleotide-binding universal stress UspA family protein
MAREAIEDALRELNLQDVTVSLEQGDIPHTLRSKAHAIGADLLIIGRGSHDDAAGRLKSRTYEIIRDSECPVISV